MPKPTPLTPRNARLAFALLCLFFLGTTHLWLRLDRSPPAWDDGYYLTRSLILYDALTNGGVREFAKEFLTVMGTKPPLIAVLPTPVYLIAGRHARAALEVNLVGMLVMFSALYRMGRRYARPRAGLLAVVIAGSMPMLYGLSRWYLVECLLTAVVCVALCLIGEREMAGSTRWSVLLGVTFALGLLLKFSFPVYVLIPLLALAIQEGKRVLRMGVVVGIGVPVAALALPWYWLNLGPALNTAVTAGSQQTAHIYGTGGIFSIADMWRYLANVSNAAPVLYVAALPVLLAAFARRAQPLTRQGLLLCGLWSAPIVGLVFGHYRDLRYAAPLFPALALALAILLDAGIERYGAPAMGATAILLVPPTLSLLQTSFGIFGNQPFEWNGLLFVQPQFEYAQRYDPARWPYREMLADLYRGARLTGGERMRLLIGTDSGNFNADNFALSALESNLPFDIATTAFETDAGRLRSSLDSASYFIYKEGGQPGGPFNPLAGGAVNAVRANRAFVEATRRRLPDDGIAHVFQRVFDPSAGAGAFLEAGLEHVADCDVTFDGKIELTGLSIDRTPEGLEVKYRWRCHRPVDKDYWCFTHVLDSQGKVAGYLDHRILGGQPSLRLWRPGDTAVEKLLFRWPAAGERELYHLRLGLFDRGSGERLRISDSEFPVTNDQTGAVVNETAARR